MKPQEFLKENEFIGDDAHNMHQSHQHHMLREECYHSAANAIKLHKLLGELPDGHDLDAWAAEKISIANDYLKTVTEWLEYDVMSGERPHASGMTAFDIAEAEEKFAELLGESDAVRDVAEDRTETKNDRGEVTQWQDEGPWKKSTGKDPRGQVTRASDRARRETEKLNKQPTVAEVTGDIQDDGKSIIVKISSREYNAMTPEQKTAKQKEWQQLKLKAKQQLKGFTIVDTDKISSATRPDVEHGPDVDDNGFIITHEQGAAENTLDQDLDQIAESFESTLSETMSSGVSSIPAVGGGTLFGGSYQNPDNPFKQKKKSVKKSSVIKR
jgi:hypothetical protein